MKAARPEEQSSPRKVDISTPANALLDPILHRIVDESLRAGYGFAATSLALVKDRRNMRRMMIKRGFTPDQVKHYLAVIGLGGGV
ncbi:hypothetical protein [Pseudomonas sp. NBRC 111139]|uniref:Uncharacterized protein n=1 Tax=Pseudomonas caricapapayae TaxID=46678 RepID=A0ACC7LZB8_9PSED|nr:hypothetical protein [Pseudomonas sp. NBRC 111139]